MIIMALGMAQAVVILIPFAVAMSIVSVPWQVCRSIAIAAGAFYLLAVGLEERRITKAFGKVGFDDMQRAAVALLGFTLLMIPLAVPLAVIGSCRTSSNGNREADHLQKGLHSIKLDIKICLKLLMDNVFTPLIPLAVPLAVIGLLLDSLMMFGSGLKSFGEGLVAFNKVNGNGNRSNSLALFTNLLILWDTIGCYGIIVALPLIALSAGLMDLQRWHSVKLD